MSDLLGMRAPDLVEPIIGWRGWSVRKSESGRYYLHSPQQGDCWRDGQLVWDGSCRCIIEAMHQAYQTRLQACRYTQDTVKHFLRHQSAAEQRVALQHLATLEEMETIYEQLLSMGCHCGINAFVDPQTLTSTSYTGDHEVQALGQVQLSGEVRGYERGWRAQAGRAAALWATSAEHEQAVRAAAVQVGAAYEGIWEDRH